MNRLLAVFGILLGLSGLFLAARQWDVFQTSFVDNLSAGGLIGFAAKGIIKLFLAGV